MEKINDYNPADMLYDRKLRDYPDELFEHIRNHGQLVPIVITRDLVVVDGAARAQIALKLGRLVRTIMVDSYPQVFELMEKLRLESLGTGFAPHITTRRIYEINRSATPMVKAYHRKRRLSNLKASAYNETHLQLRRALAGAVGSKSLHAVQTAINLYATLEGKHSKIGQVVVKEHEDGILSSHQAYARFARLRDGSDFFLPMSDEQNVDEQQKLLLSATSRLGGLLRGLTGLGELSPEWKTNELREILKSLKTQRALMQRFIKLFEEKVNQREQG